VRAEISRVIVGAVALAAVTGGVVAAYCVGRSDRLHRASSSVSVTATPGVVLAIRDLARLDATSFHIEKVVEVSDSQSRLWGFLQVKDTLLLVAVGDVVAGVDLAKLGDDDVTLDSATHVLHVRLPASEVLSSTLDERSTRVYSRSTDVLASRNEHLEGEARAQAEDMMRKEAVDGGILERARASAEATLRALLRPLGYAEVDIEWPDRG
jgi:hypothetical protein